MKTRVISITSTAILALIFSNTFAQRHVEEIRVLETTICCKFELGDEEGALKDLERILALNPDARDQFKEERSDEYFTELRKEVEQAYLAKQ
jgi:hypothetical protein